MENKILYIILNGELNMSAGKGAAQAVHAAMMLQDAVNTFANCYRRTVIVLEAKNAEQIKNLAEYCDSANLRTEYYIDEGVNEVDAFSVTALAVEPFGDKDAERREVFESFPLFVGEHPPKDETRRTRAAGAIRGAIPFSDDRPRFVRKTIKWLEKS